MKIPFLIFMIFCSVLSAQTDWVRWEGKTVSYQIPSSDHHEYRVDNSSFGMKTLSALRNTYYFLVSDLDGDNCPFYPTCSAFLVQAVKETNILKGTLMFADRFTRDINFFKGSDHYPYYGNGKFYDPAENYTLRKEQINYYPGGEFVNGGKD